MKTLILTLFGLFLSATASAHAGLPTIWEPVFDGDELVGLSGTWGLVTFDHKNRPRWVCEEATREVTIAYAYADGTWFSATRDGLLKSTDHGCTWSPVEGLLEGRTIGGWRRNPNDGDDILAATDERSRDNFILRSRDGGTTWEAVTPPYTLGGIRSVRSDFDGALIVSAAINAEQGWQIFRVENDTWQPDSPPFDPYFDLLIASEPDEPPLALALDENGWHIYTWTADALQRLGSLEIQPLAARWAEDGTVEIATDTGTLIHWSDGESVEVGRSTCLLDTPQGPIHCGTADDALLFRPADDRAFDDDIRWQEVIPRQCTAEPTHPCATLWPITASWFGGDPAPELPSETAPDSGCAAAGPPFLWAGWFLSFWVLHRRRR